MKYVIILGDNLFPTSAGIIKKGDHVFMAEDYSLCTHFNYHKLKLILFLSAMRHYRDDLAKSDIKVTYHELKNGQQLDSYEDNLYKWCSDNNISELHCYEIQDKFFKNRLIKFAKVFNINLIFHASPMFMVSDDEFTTYLKSYKRPFMKTFYEWYRRRSKILMDQKGKPLGGKFSFDSENRKKLPNNITIPEPNLPKQSKLTLEVAEMININFKSHPGITENIWFPITRKEALKWVHEFFDIRFRNFGDYEDAITNKHTFIFHSAISPLFNLGLITPKEVINTALEYYESGQAPLNSVEGFIRQIIGWREFIRGIYQNYSEKQEQSNFFNATERLGSEWYNGTTGIDPLDDAIKKALNYGYNHHIERLMIISNIMLLSNIDPKQVHRWFMEMYIDSADWVMGPNVYGMGQFSDGGIFATKPYICGSNYILKMSDYKKGDWCKKVDELYWGFVKRHRDYLAKNPRTSLMVKALERKA